MSRKPFFSFLKCGAQLLDSCDLQFKRFFLLFFTSVQAGLLLYFTIYNFVSGEKLLANLELAGFLVALFFVLWVFVQKKYSWPLAMFYLVICVFWTYSSFMFKLDEYILLFSLFVSLSSFYLLGSTIGMVYSVIYGLGILVVANFSRAEVTLGHKGYLNFFASYVLINCIVFFYQRNYEITFRDFMRLNTNLKDMSIKDTLTDLYNKRYYTELFEKEERRSRRLNYCLGLAVIDLDHFRNYNELYGHIAGDDVIVRFSGVLKECFSRSSDSLFRMGGEEFGVILSAKDSQLILESFNRLKRQLEKEAIAHSGNAPSDVMTVSCGLVIVEADYSLSPETIYKKAAHLLHEAKEAGRNTIKYQIV